MKSEDAYRLIQRKIIIPLMIYLAIVFVSTIAFLLFLFSPISEFLDSSIRIMIIVSFFLICILPTIPLSKYSIKIKKQIIAEREKDALVTRTYDP